MATIDIVVLCVLIVFGIVGMIRGFLDTLISLFGNLFSLGIAILCSKPVSKFLDSIFHIVDGIGGKIASSLSGTVKPFVDNIEAVNDGVLTGAELKDYMKGDSLANRALKLFVEDSKEFVRTEGTDAAAMDTQVVNYVGAQIAKIVAIVIAVIVMFVIIRIAILLLAKLFDALSKNKVVSGIDRAVGLLFGLIKGSILVCIVLAVFYLIANQTVLNWIDGSTITKWVYTYVCEFVEFLVSKFNLPKQITELFPQLTSGK